MIIQVLANLKEEGYLKRGRHPTIAPFFAGANVAFRRKALAELGGFDPECVTGEDCDLCARLSSRHWELYLKSDAVVAHHNPSTLRRVFRQWYGYGRYHPYVFAKHNERALELYARIGRPIDGERHVCLFYRRVPVGIVVFLTRFLLMHVTLLAAVGVWLMGWHVAGGIMIAVAAGLISAYAWPDVRRWGVRGIGFAMVRYVADLALFLGGFVGGLRQKMLYLSATID